MRCMKAGKRGFTLIELLVVIAIIMILAAILFPVFARAKQQAQKTACINNLKQIGYAIQQYMNDWDNRFPLVSGAGPEIDNLFFSSSYNWRAPGTDDWRWFQNLVVPYARNQKIFMCSSAQNTVWEIDGSNEIEVNKNNWRGAEPGGLPPPEGYDPPTSYWYNCFPVTGEYMGGLSEESCSRVSEAPMLFDMPAGFDGGGQEAQIAHIDAINVAYVDTHVKAFPLEPRIAPWLEYCFYNAPDPSRDNEPMGSRGWFD